MKKVLSFLLISALLISLSSCENAEIIPSEETETSSVTTEETSVTTTENIPETVVQTQIETEIPEQNLPEKTVGVLGPYDSQVAFDLKYDAMEKYPDLINYKNIQYLTFDRAPKNYRSFLKNCPNLKTLEIEEFTLTPYNFTEIEKFEKLEKLEILDTACTNNNIANFADYNNENLRYLRLEGGNYDDISALEHFKDLPNFNNLALYSTGNIDITPILEIKNLKQLTLPDEVLTEENVKLLLENLPNLKGLNRYEKGNRHTNIYSYDIIDGILSEEGTFRTDPPEISSGVGEVINWTVSGNKINYDDSNAMIENLVRLQTHIYEGEITENDVLEISQLNFEYSYDWENGYKNPTDLSDLKYLKNLTFFMFPNYVLDDYSYISELKNLTGLTFQSADFSKTDLSFIGEHTSLLELNMGYCNLTDISFLEPLVNLEEISLGGNKITDITPLENMPYLETVWLKDNRITDVSPLKNYQNTDHGYINLENNYIDDWSPLSHVEDVIIPQKTDSRLTPKDGYIEIGGIYFYKERPEFDVRYKLSYPWNVQIPTEELSKLANFTKLKELKINMTSSQYEVLAPLKDLKRLEINFIEKEKTPENKTKTMETILKMENLEILHITDLDEESFQLFKDYKNENLKDLILSNLNTKDLSPLENLQSLEKLSIIGDEVFDLTAVSKLTSLQTLFIHGAENYDLTPLYEMENLKSFGFSYGEVSEEELEAFQKACPNCEIIYGE